MGNAPTGSRRESARTARELIRFRRSSHCTMQTFLRLSEPTPFMTETIPPTDTRTFFRPVVIELVDLLRELPTEAWDAPTVARAWRVRDVVSHLLDTTLRRLSFHRDRHQPPPPSHPF